jgi:hypothetical protein
LDSIHLFTKMFLRVYVTMPLAEQFVRPKNIAMSPARCVTKNGCADEDQQQFTRPTTVGRSDYTELLLRMAG